MGVLNGFLKRLRTPRFIVVYPLVACFFIVGHITEASLRIGIGLVLIGEALRCWANGYVGKAKVNESDPRRPGEKIGRLITAGPYAFVRHPLYLGTFLIAAGFAFAVGNLWLGLAVIVCFTVVYQPKIAEEEAVLCQECGQEYALYRSAVPQLLPRGFPYGRRMGQWSWGGILASKEWKTVFWSIISVIFLYFWEELVQEREGLLSRHSVFRLSLLIVAFSLAAADGLFQLIQFRARKCRE